MLASAPIDLRKGHDGLVSLVRMAYDADPYDGTIFVFVGRRAARRTGRRAARAPQHELCPGLPLTRAGVKRGFFNLERGRDAALVLQEIGARPCTADCPHERRPFDFQPVGEASYAWHRPAHPTRAEVVERSLRDAADAVVVRPAAAPGAEVDRPGFRRLHGEVVLALVEPRAAELARPEARQREDLSERASIADHSASVPKNSHAD